MRIHYQRKRTLILGLRTLVIGMTTGAMGSACAQWNAGVARLVKDCTFDLGFAVLLSLTLTLFFFVRRHISLKVALRLICLILLLALPGLRGACEWAALPLRHTSAALGEQARSTGCLNKGSILIVLGGGIWSPTLPTESSMMRTIEASTFAQRRDAEAPLQTVVFAGGWNTLAHAVESKVLANVFRAFYKAPERFALITEEESHNTRENGLFVRRKLAPSQREIILLTSDYHFPRSRGVFRRLGFEVCALPVSSPEIQSIGFLNFSNAQKFMAIANEYAGFVGYTLMSWLSL